MFSIQRVTVAVRSPCVATKGASATAGSLFQCRSGTKAGSARVESPGHTQTKRCFSTTG